MSDSQPPHQGNPLIGLTNGDTIESLYNYVEYLCLSADGDGTTHPGMGLSLQLVLGAVDSLKGGERTE